MDCSPEYNRTTEGFTEEKDSASKTTEIQAANPTTDQKALLATLKIELMYIKSDKLGT